MSTNSNRAAIYTRISFDRSGQQLGTRRQLEDCQKLAADNGLEVAGHHHYDDNSRSAFNGKLRKGFEALLAAALAGEFDTVLVWDDDRLHRDIWDYARMVKARLNILTVTSGPMNLGDAAGELVGTVKAGMNVYESRHKSQRATRESRQRAERGIPRWRNSFGYAHDGSRQPNPVTAPYVVEAYRRILHGDSLATVCKYLNDNDALTEHWTKRRDDNGVVVIPDPERPQRAEMVLTRSRWTPPALSDFLRKHRNAGLRTHNGTVVAEGTWPALVDRDLFDAVQSILNRPERKPGRRTTNKHLLTGVLVCGVCGSTLRAYQDGYGKQKYRCAPDSGCGTLSVLGEPLEKIARDLVVGRLSRRDAVKLVRAAEVDAAKTTELDERRAVLMAQAEEFGYKLVDASPAKAAAYSRALDRIDAELATIDAAHGDDDRRQLLDGIPLGKPEVGQHVDSIIDSSPDRFRSILDLLAEVKVEPVGKGGRARPVHERVTVTPR
jgi:DNA invertase Pin-like site-specific DNA recombinase